VYLSGLLDGGKEHILAQIGGHGHGLRSYLEVTRTKITEIQMNWHPFHIELFVMVSTAPPCNGRGRRSNAPQPLRHPGDYRQAQGDPTGKKIRWRAGEGG
jgi:hypothetical protein